MQQDSVLGVSSIRVGVKWDEKSSSDTDLDIACVELNFFARILDAAFFNKIKSDDSAITHSGDNIDEEGIQIDFNLLNPEVKVLAITITCGNEGDFSLVETARVNVTSGSNEIASFSAGCVGKHTGFIPCIFYKAPNGWVFRGTSISGEGRNFKELEGVIRSSIVDIIPQGLQEEGTFSDPKKVFQLEKGGAILLRGQHFMMGLGWDASGVDIDSSCVIFKGKDRVENVWWDHKHGGGGAVHLKGDRRSGKGKGDDEQIIVKGEELEKQYNVLIFSICIYTDLTYFSSVKNAYCRLVDMETQQELCIYRLDSASMYGETGMKMCALIRLPTNNWMLKVLGEGCIAATVEGLDFNSDFSDFGLNDYDITIVEARGLAAKDLNGWSDPYVKVLAPLKVKSEVIKKSLDPVWNFRLDTISSRGAPILQIEVWDKDFIKDDFLGCATIECAKGIGNDNWWIPLNGHSISGDIRVRVSKS